MPNKNQREYIPGVMWQPVSKEENLSRVFPLSSCRPLSMEEYEYWQYRLLPFGWMIICEPKPL